LFAERLQERVVLPNWSGQRSHVAE
jgi:hypothetical protein